MPSISESMHEVDVGIEVDLTKDITFSFESIRKSGSTVVVESVSPNGIFGLSGICKDDELMSFSGIEASKFKDIQSLFVSFEMIRYPSVRCVFYREKETSPPPPPPTSNQDQQVNKSPLRVPDMAWADVDHLDLRTSSGSNSAAVSNLKGPNGKWRQATQSNMTNQMMLANEQSNMNNNHSNINSSTHSEVPTELSSHAPSSISLSGMFGPNQKQPCNACQAPWVEQKGIFADGKHSRGCRLCGISYCADCKYTHMIKTKGSSSGGLDMSSHHPPPSSTNVTSSSPPAYRRNTINHGTSSSLPHSSAQGGVDPIRDEEDNMSVTPSSAAAMNVTSRWICRGCADEVGVKIGPPCSVCNAPWMDKSSFMGANSQHSRECITCHKSFCSNCKKTNMIREKTTDAIRQSFTSKPTMGRQNSGMFASFSSRLSFSVHESEANESSARAPLHRYECLTCRAEHMYQPIHKTETPIMKTNTGKSSKASTNQNLKPKPNPKAMQTTASSSSSSSLKKPSRRASEPVMKRSTSPVPYPPVSTSEPKSWMKTVTIEVHEKEKLGIDMDNDLVITRVFPGFAADRAGLQYGWAILEIDNVRVINHPQAQRAIINAFERGPGTKFNIIVSTTGR